MRRIFIQSFNLDEFVLKDMYAFTTTKSSYAFLLSKDGCSIIVSKKYLTGIVNKIICEELKLKLIQHGLMKDGLMELTG